MKPSQPGSSGLDFRRLRRKTRCGIVQYIPGRLPRRHLHGQRHFQPAIARVIRCPRHWKIIANDGFGDQVIGTRCEAVAKAKFDIEHAELEIRHAEYLLPLLLKWQKVFDLAEIGIVFDADEAVLAEIARKSCRGQKIRFAERSEIRYRQSD